MAKSPDTRAFSAKRHAQGQWDTTVVKTGGPLMRAALCYSSRKRKGVGKCWPNNLFYPPSRLTREREKGPTVIGFWDEARRPSLPLIGRLTRCGRLSLPLPAEFSACARIQRLPFRPNTADALYSIDALGHVRDCVKALDEFSRVCKPWLRFFHP